LRRINRSRRFILYAGPIAGAPDLVSDLRYAGEYEVCVFGLAGGIKSPDEDPATVRKSTNEILGFRRECSAAIYRRTPYFLDWVFGINAETHRHWLVTQIGVFGRKGRFRLLLSAPQDECGVPNDQPGANLGAIIGR
jgi:hypothetical protein